MICLPNLRTRLSETPLKLVCRSKSYRLYESISKTRHWWPRNMKWSSSRTMHAESPVSLRLRNWRSSISALACCKKGFLLLMILIATGSARSLSCAFTTCPNEPLPMTDETMKRSLKSSPLLTM
eukprot:7378732-Prymnesium_polylepis.1